MSVDTDDLLVESTKDRRIDELEKEVNMLRRANFTFAGLETSKEALEKYSMFQPYENGEWGDVAEKAIAHAQGLEVLLKGRAEQNAKLRNELAEARATIAETRMIAWRKETGIGQPDNDLSVAVAAIGDALEFLSNLSPHVSEDTKVLLNFWRRKGALDSKFIHLAKEVSDWRRDLTAARMKIDELQTEILSRTAATEGMFDQLYVLLEDANAYTVVPSDTSILCTCEDEECPVLIRVGEHGELIFENDLGHSTMVLPDNYFIGEKLIVERGDD